MGDRLHIYPKGDLREHQISAHCWCKPTCDTELIIHNAADGREFFEAEEREAFKQGLADIAAGRIRPLSAIRNELLQARGGEPCPFFY